MKPWVPSLAPHNPSEVAPICNPSTMEAGRISSSRIAWAIWEDPGSKNIERKEEKKYMKSVKKKQRLFMENLL